MHRSRARLMASRITMPSSHQHSKKDKPSPAAMIEARRAHKAVAEAPLRYAFGDPLPGRSALDKMKKEMR